jgi:hypothetical protein
LNEYTTNFDFWQNKSGKRNDFKEGKFRRQAISSGAADGLPRRRSTGAGAFWQNEARSKI